MDLVLNFATEPERRERPACLGLFASIGQWFVCSTNCHFSSCLTLSFVEQCKSSPCASCDISAALEFSLPDFSAASLENKCVSGIE